MRFGTAPISLVPPLLALAIVLHATTLAANDKKPPLNATLHGENRKPAKIGSSHSILISSDLSRSEIPPLVTDGGKSETYRLVHADATYLAVHFKTMDLPDQCQLEIAEGNHEYDTVVFSKKGFHDLETFWARHVIGDTMDITISCNETIVDDSGAGFVIDEYAAGYPAVETPVSSPLEEERRDTRASDTAHGRAVTVCDAVDKKNAVCYESSHETYYLRSRAVARLYIRGSYSCTGWLVGHSPSLLVTNQHCIASQSDVDNTDFEFMGEEPSCDATSGNCMMCDRGEIFDGGTFLKADKTKDYALVELEGNPALEYGYLHIEPRELHDNEPIYIPQHPNGRAKELAIADSSSRPATCRILNMQPPCDPSTPFYEVAYKCDTEGGSSGAPVLSAESHKVIALHHCGGGCMGNLGVPANEFYNDIKVYLSSGADACPAGFFLFHLGLTTDHYPEENSWKLTYGDCSAKAGEVVLEGQGYGPNTVNNIEECLPQDCYTFTIYDAYEDGMCCDYGDGSYVVAVAGKVIASAKKFGASDSTSFGAPPSLDTSPPELVSSELIDTDDASSDIDDIRTTSITDLYENDFENEQESSYTLGGVHASYRRSRYAHSGRGVIVIKSNLADASSISFPSLPVSSSIAIMVKFWFRSDRFVSGDSFVVEYQSGDNGGEWKAAGRRMMPDGFRNSEWYEETFDIDTADLDEIVVRFRCDAYGNRKLLLLDDIHISGISV